MRYYIVNKQNRPLSTFYPNALPGRQLRFSNKDWYLYRTPKEAEDHLQYIQSRIEPKVMGETLRIAKG